MSFSYFKILALPFLLFGYQFYLANRGAENYFSFNSEIYSSAYSRIALLSYYLPDIFYFISAFTFTGKLIQLDELEDNKLANIFTAFLKKLLKLYPSYLAIIVVYWAITPSLHAGPLWNVYLGEV